ncbi:MAG: hypothetical protein AAF664_12230 [Planctomycetota bacterium]
MEANADGVNIVYTDEGNFITPFSNLPVVRFSFTFASGFSITDAIGFSETTTVQNILSSTQFRASDGEIAGFAGGSFRFNMTSIRTGDSVFNGVSVDDIACVVGPCPQRGAEFAFRGVFPNEINTGRFVLVPEPGVLAVLAPSCLPMMLRRYRKH